MSFSLHLRSSLFMLTDGRTHPLSLGLAAARIKVHYSPLLSLIFVKIYVSSQFSLNVDSLNIIVRHIDSRSSFFTVSLPEGGGMFYALFFSLHCFLAKVHIYSYSLYDRSQFKGRS